MFLLIILAYDYYFVKVPNCAGQKLFSCLTTSREQYNEASVTPACEEYLRQGASSSKTDDGTDDVIGKAIL